MKKNCFLLLFCLPWTVVLNAQEAPPGIDDPITVQQLSLDIHINTTYSETAPVLSGDGKTLYFVREGHPNNLGDANNADIWVSYLQSAGGWSNAVHLPTPLNTRQSNRILATEISGDVIYLEDRYQQNDNAGGIARSVRIGRSWSKPQSMVIEGFAPVAAERAHYQVDVSGNFLLLAAVLPEGQGKRDLYVCFRNDSLHWSKPLPLGNVLNTSGEEARAFLAADGRTLYFASDGRGGYGGLDWFYTFRIDESWTQWSEPQQLGKDVNTADDDRFLAVSHWGESAIVSRQDREDNGDLTMVILPPNLRPKAMTVVTGRVLDARTGQVMRLQVARRLPQAENRQEPLMTRADGQFSLLAPCQLAPGGYICPKGYFVTSNHLDAQREALREEDADPYHAFGAATLNPLYFQREAEIENLSLRLHQIDIELQETARLRTVWKEKTEAPRALEPKDWKSDNVPELQGLQQRYDEYLSRLKDTVVAPMQVMIAPKPEETSIPEISPAFADNGQAADEWAEMRRRMQNHQRVQPILKTYDNPAAATQAQVEVRPPSFDELTRVIRDSLRHRLHPEVRQAVSRELIGEVMAELAREPNGLSEQETALRDQIRQGLSASTMSHGALPAAPAATPEKDWDRLFRADIEKALSERVRNELAQEMRPDVKGTLKNEALFLLRKEQSATLRRTLSEKVIQQIREEEKKIAEFSEDLPLTPVTSGDPVTVEAPARLQADIVLMPIEAGQVVLLKDVFFEPGSAQLKAVSYAELENVWEMLRANPGMVIEIGAHTHGGISHALAMQLSSQRARVIADYLINKGIPKESVPYRGYGKVIPIASNDTPEGRKINQRIEFNILKMP